MSNTWHYRSAMKNRVKDPMKTVKGKKQGQENNCDGTKERSEIHGEKCLSHSSPHVYKSKEDEKSVASER